MELINGRWPFASRRTLDMHSSSHEIIARYNPRKTCKRKERGCNVCGHSGQSVCITQAMRVAAGGGACVQSFARANFGVEPQENLRS